MKEYRGFQFFYVIEESNGSGDGPIDPPNPDLGFIDFDFEILNREPQIETTSSNATTRQIRNTVFITTGAELETILDSQTPNNDSSSCSIDDTDVPIGSIIR